MRDPQRIDRMVAMIRAYWHRYPDLRLGQLITNLYFEEDDDLERRLRATLREE